MPSEVNSDLLWNSGWIYIAGLNYQTKLVGINAAIFFLLVSVILPLRMKFSYLPIIDLNPSDETCIYSTLNYVQSQAWKLNIPTPCITFDQPLWIKAVEITKAKSMNIVCRLGGFHTIISFIGSLGTMMKGSGMEEIFGIVYDKNTVTHMIT